jgi:hypothetical protein
MDCVLSCNHDEDLQDKLFKFQHIYGTTNRILTKRKQEGYIIKIFSK